MSLETIGVLERGTRRAPYPDTVERLAQALELCDDARVEFAAAARRARPDLPAPLTRLVGREDDVAAIMKLIAERRLVCLTGTSGIGKTRVALEVATRYAQDSRNDACFVDLSSPRENVSIAANIASALGLRRIGDVTSEFLAATLGSLSVLLVLDHCERRIEEAATTVMIILQRCARVRVLVTSGERLGVVGELLYRLRPLALPPQSPQNVDEARAYSAIALFAERGHDEAGFVLDAASLETTVEICRHLAGNPRAIESAARRLPLVGLRALHAAIQRVAFSEAVRPSYDVLCDLEQTLVRRLSIFPAGWTLDAAEAICADERLTRASVAPAVRTLVDKSLIDATYTAEKVRYQLPESVRAYGMERLAGSGEFEEVSRRYARWLAER